MWSPVFDPCVKGLSILFVYPSASTSIRTRTRFHCYMVYTMKEQPFLYAHECCHFYEKKNGDPWLF